MQIEFLVITLLIIGVIFLWKRVATLQSLLEEQKFQKASIVTKHGMTYEQLAPFAKNFPGDPRAFRFIGNPIDGIHFGDDKITFIEFKTGASRLAVNQKAVKALVEQGLVEWKEIRDDQQNQ